MPASEFLKQLFVSVDQIEYGAQCSLGRQHASPMHCKNLVITNATWSCRRTGV